MPEQLQVKWNIAHA